MTEGGSMTIDERALEFVQNGAVIGLGSGMRGLVVRQAPG